MEKQINEEHSRIIDALGGPTEVSKLCGDVTPQGVCKWRRSGIPSYRLKYFRLAKKKIMKQIENNDQK